MMRDPKRTSGETVTSSHHEASVHAPERVADDSVHARRLSRPRLRPRGRLALVLWSSPWSDSTRCVTSPPGFCPAAAGIVLGSATYVWAAWRAVRSVAGTGAPISPKVLGVALGLPRIVGHFLSPTLRR